jgi:hypothetical protein
MKIKEGDKLYEIDEKTGLVRVASVVSDDAVSEDDIHIHDRVDVDGETGTVISITASLYGGAYGVRFDNGDVDEYPVSSLKRSSVEEPVFETPIHEIVSRFQAYEQLPAYTNDEIGEKEREARFLNLRAKALGTDSKLALNDQNTLGRIVLVTGNDLTDLKTARETSEETTQYVGRFNHYRLAGEISGHGPGLGLTGDASWLDDAIEGMEVVETTDADLAARAAELVSAFTKAQLEDDDFMQVAASYHRTYLQMDDAQAKKFELYLARARKDRVAEIPAETKTASTEEDLADFDASSLFL